MYPAPVVSPSPAFTLMQKGQIQYHLRSKCNHLQVFNSGYCLLIVSYTGSLQSGLIKCTKVNSELQSLGISVSAQSGCARSGVEIAGPSLKN
mmetsp:Transcript_11669/g.22105  ORF Transcript_11669/g.22105 Transcript_11669/m.22105 type:complete len:92 (-) Transcript_11669:495-770(-)